MKNKRFYIPKWVSWVVEEGLFCEEYVLNDVFTIKIEFLQKAASLLNLSNFVSESEQLFVKFFIISLLFDQIF